MKMTLSIYLFKNGANKQAVLTDRGKAATEHVVNVNDEVQAEMLSTSNTGGDPSWMSFFEGAVAPWPQLTTSSYGAVLLVSVEGRLWGITFGALGRHLIDQTLAVRRFGLITTLSAVGKNSLRGFDAQKFDEVFRKVVEHSSTDAETKHFGWDIEQDLIKAVVGRPKKKSLGDVMAGADKLSLRGDFELADLPSVLTEILKAYESKSYIKNGFDWIDNIVPVHDEDTVDLLEIELVDVILDPKRNHSVAVALPGTMGLGEEVRYAFNKKSEYYMLSIEDVVAELGMTLDIQRLKGKKISVSDQDGQTTEVPLYRCLLAQLDYEKATTYLLSDGQWFAVSPSWVASVDKVVNGIKKRSLIPEFDPGKHRIRGKNGWQLSEAKWCEDVATSMSAAAVLDKTLVYIGGGSSSIEFADIFDGKLIIQAKRYHSSASPKSSAS